MGKNKAQDKSDNKAPQNEIVCKQESELVDESQHNPLEEYGIVIERTRKTSPKWLERHGYKKLPPEAAARISAMIQYAPGMLANQATKNAANAAIKDLSEGAYKVVVKDGLHLAKSRTTEKAFKGLWFNDSGDLVTHADWLKVHPVELSSISQYALGAFNVMSMVTGQYFMSEINSKLSNIEESVDDIKAILETSKRSELWACERTLNNIQANLFFIKTNEHQRQATLLELKTVKQTSLTHIKYYGDMVKRYRTGISIKSDKEDLMKAVSEIGKNLPLFWSAISIYGRASLLDSLLSEMDNPDYLNNVYDDILECKDQYISEYKDCKETLLTFSNKAKALRAGKAIDILETASEALIHTGVGGFALGMTGTLATGLYKKSKEEAKKAFDDSAKVLLDACGDVDALDFALDSIEFYQKINDSPLEIVQSGDDSYIKFAIDEEDSEE